MDGISWAEGTVPHPRGVVRVAWEVRGETLFVEMDEPDGVTYSVEPRGALAGKGVWVNGVPRPGGGSSVWRNSSI